MKKGAFNLMSVIQVDEDNFYKYKTDIQKLLKYSYEINFPSDIYDEIFFNDKIKEIEEYIILKKGNINLYILDGQVKGFIWFFIKSNFCKKVHINQLVVSEKYQGEGIGVKLLNSVENFAKSHDIKNIELIVDVNNEKAQNFYFKEKYKRKKIILEKEVD